MPDFAFLSTSTVVALLGILGLLIGSFLNVVIHRLPRMMENEWAGECRELLGQESPPPERYDLLMPRSACPHCQHPIRWWENIPVFSYLALRGKCSSCKADISARYPIIETVTGLLFAWCGYRYGATWTALAWCVFSALLVSMTCIDWDTQLLPDSLTYSLLWLGLFSAALGWLAVPLHDAVMGAIACYLFLWIIANGFKLLTGKIGMGNGDFKLFAALGAWFGWQALVPLILLASLVGAVIGIAMKVKNRSNPDLSPYIPFGPFLAGAGLLAMLVGTAPLLRFIGLMPPGM